MIPTTFKMGGYTWRVRILTSKKFQLHLNRKAKLVGGTPHKAVDLWGVCDQVFKVILLNDDYHIGEEHLEETFWHELAHCLQYSLGDQDHDEAAIERLGLLLHQFDKTRS